MSLYGVFPNFRSGALIFFLVSGGLASNPLSAANDDGQYAVRGVGSTTCNAFLQQVSDEGELPLRYVAWVSGYLSALNRLESSTFDVSYIHENDDILALAGRLCASEEELLLETALARLVTFMSNSRLTRESDLVRLQSGENQAVVRRETYDRFLGVLVEQGFLQTAKEFDEDVRDAIMAFQTEKGLQETGLPDTNTLVLALAPEA